MTQFAPPKRHSRRRGTHMSLQQKKVGAPAEAAPLAVARPTGGNGRNGMAAPSNGQTACLNQPAAVVHNQKWQRGNANQNSKAGNSPPTGGADTEHYKKGKGNTHHKGKAGKFPTEEKQKSQKQQHQKHFDSVGGCTSKYIRIKSSPPTTQSALDAANIWIATNSKSIDDREQYYCPECGQVELTICGCHLKPQQPQVNIAPPEPCLFPRPVKTTFEVTYENGWFHETTSDKFDAKKLNNASMFDMDNSVLSDEYICAPMYNYIRLHMSGKYGSRTEKYTHCHKLALKFLELKKTKPEELSTLQTNMVLVTVQRVTDQIENSWISKELDPTPNRYFPRAWLRNWWLILFVRLVLIISTIINWLLLKPLGAVYRITGPLPLVLTPLIYLVGISVRSALVWAVGYGDMLTEKFVFTVLIHSVRWGNTFILVMADLEQRSDETFGENFTIMWELLMLLIPVVITVRILLWLLRRLFR